VLPSAILYYLLEAVNVEHTVPNVITAFQAYNAALLACCAVLWWRIATLAGLSRRSSCVGFGGFPRAATGRGEGWPLKYGGNGCHEVRIRMRFRKPQSTQSPIRRNPATATETG